MSLTVRTVPTDWLCELFVCQICKKQIQKGDKIIRDYQGSVDNWLHVTCWDAAWHEHMEQHKLTLLTRRKFTRKMEKSIFLKKIAEMAEMAEMPTPQGYSAAKLFLANIYRNRLGGYDNYINAPYLESFLEGKYDDEDECKAAEQSEFLFQEEYREVYLSSEKIQWFCSKNKITHPGYTGRNYRGNWVGSDSTHTYSFAGAIPGSPNVYVKFNEDYAYYIVCDKKKFKSELLSDGYHPIDDVANKGYIVKTKSELIETGWGFEDLPDDGSLFLWKQKEYK